MPPFLAPVLGSVATGLAGSLFGADDNDRNVELAREAAAPQLWAGMTPYADPYLSDARDIYNRGGFSPIVNPLELLGRSNVLGYAEETLPGLVGATQQSWLRGLNPGLDPYVGALIQAGQNDLIQDFERRILPRIGVNAIGVSGYGGSRQGVAEGLAAEGLLEAKGDLSTRLLSDAHGKSLAQQQAAWSMAPNMVNMGFLPAQTQQQVGGQYRTDAMQPAQNLTGYGGALAPFIHFGGGAQGFQPGPGAFQTGLGTASASYPFWSEIFSSPGTASNPLAQAHMTGSF